MLVIYLDDLIIFSKSLTAGIRDTHVALVFLMNLDWLINPTKSPSIPKQLR